MSDELTIEWRPIENFDGFYEVSSAGDVRSVKTGKVLAKNSVGRGYVKAELWKDGDRWQTTVHRAVAKAFLGPPPNDRPEVNHKDGDKTNNNVSNLEWVSRRENVVHSMYELGFGVKPVSSWDALTGEMKHYASIAEAGRDGFSETEIYRCLKGVRAQYEGKLWGPQPPQPAPGWDGLARAYLVGRGYDACKIDDLKEANSAEWSVALQITKALLRSSQSTSDAGGGVPTAVTYTNYRGETSVRSIVPKSVRYGSTEWHPEPQWLLLAYDTEKKADREFALKDFGLPDPGGADAGVGVKPLEWEDRRAPSIFGTYFLSSWSSGRFSIKRPGRYEDGKSYATIDEAKAAAQADYETRILPALATLSPPAGERREAIARINKIVSYAFNEGWTQGTIEETSRRGGRSWEEFKSRYEDEINKALASGLVQDEAAIRADEREKLRNRLDSYLDDFLCGMKEGWDDSVSGFNDAWDVVRKVFDAAAIRSARDGGEA